MWKLENRRLAFGGSSARRGGGAGVVLYDNDGTNVSLRSSLSSFALIVKLNTRL